MKNLKDSLHRTRDILHKLRTELKTLDQTDLVDNFMGESAELIAIFERLVKKTEEDN